MFKAKVKQPIPAKPRQLDGVVQPCRTSLRFQDGPSFREVIVEEVIANCGLFILT